jgi:hypothetical protein
VNVGDLKACMCMYIGSNLNQVGQLASCADLADGNL